MSDNQTQRTDLALEARQLFTERTRKDEIPGVRVSEQNAGRFPVSTVEILDSRGEEALGKPVGCYTTVELDGLFRREENAFAEAASLLADQLQILLSPDENASFLVVGLGNREITPDAIGPLVADHIIVTRHLKAELPVDFSSFRTVSAIRSGVLGTTGIESSQLVHAVVQQVTPTVVIAVDALASRSTDRLCRTVQISNTGIVPGSGVGNARSALNQDALGVPVIAIGVPTVVDAVTLTLDLASRAGVDLDPSCFGGVGNMIVTPRDIDKNVSDIAKLIGYALNLAFHNGMRLEDVDMLLS